MDGGDRDGKCRASEKASTMKRAGKWVSIYILGLLFVSVSFAQGMTNRKIDKPVGPGNLYDLRSIERIKGDVLRVEDFIPAQGMPPGIVLVLKTEAGETIQVFLGPQWYLENCDLELEAGDRLEVKGSKITYEGKPVIVASVIIRGDEILKLRDDNGVPVWSVWAPKR
jgi:hypothetical protein